MCLIKYYCFILTKGAFSPTGCMRTLNCWSHATSRFKKAKVPWRWIWTASPITTALSSLTWTLWSQRSSVCCASETSWRSGCWIMGKHMTFWTASFWKEKRTSKGRKVLTVCCFLASICCKSWVFTSHIRFSTVQTSVCSFLPPPIPTILSVLVQPGKV